MGADKAWKGGTTLDSVLDEGGLEEIACSIPPAAMASARELLRYLAHSTDEWERVGQWRMEARTEGYRRSLKDGGL